MEKGLLHNKIDVARNIKALEWVKTELIVGVGQIYKGMLANGEEVILDALANLVTLAYLLARRCGFKFERLDLKIENRLRARDRNQDLEKWYGDYTALADYFSRRQQAAKYEVDDL